MHVPRTEMLMLLPPRGPESTNKVGFFWLMFRNHKFGCVKSYFYAVKLPNFHPTAFHFEFHISLESSSCDPGLF